MKKFEEFTMLVDMATGCGIKECAQEMKINARIIATATDDDGHEISYLECDPETLGGQFRCYIPYYGEFSYDVKNFNDMYRYAGNAFLKLIRILKKMGVLIEGGDAAWDHDWMSIPANPADCVLSKNQSVEKRGSSECINFRAARLILSGYQFDLFATDCGEIILVRVKDNEGGRERQVFNLNECIQRRINIENLVNVTADEQEQWEQIKAILNVLF